MSLNFSQSLLLTLMKESRVFLQLFASVAFQMRKNCYSQTVGLSDCLIFYLSVFLSVSFDLKYQRKCCFLRHLASEPEAFLIITTSHNWPNAVNKYQSPQKRFFDVAQKHVYTNMSVRTEGRLANFQLLFLPSQDGTHRPNQGWKSVYLVVVFDFITPPPFTKKKQFKLKNVMLSVPYRSSPASVKWIHIIIYRFVIFSFHFIQHGKKIMKSRFIAIKYSEMLVKQY